MEMYLSDSDCESYTETTDSEDQDDNEFSYGGHAQSILSSLDESIGKINDFLTFERGFMHGDIVCFTTDPSGQLGRIVGVDKVVDLETSSGDLIKDINSKMLRKVRSFGLGDYVVKGPWIGRVDKTFDLVTIVLNDGTKCEIITGDSDILIPISPGLLEDAPYPYYPGQRVRIKLPITAKSARWLCGSWETTQDEGTISHVDVGLVHVSWIASVISSTGIMPSMPAFRQDPKVLTALSCFPHANWQLGDWCTLPSDYLLEKMDPLKFVPKCVLKLHKKLGLNHHGGSQMFVIAKTRTKVDVLWQNGDLSVGLDSKTLFPVSNVGDHDFWPGQFVLEKITSEDIQVPCVQRPGIVKQVDAQEKIVKVKWIGPELKQAEYICEKLDVETVSAYELIEHPDFTYCIGDVVFRLLHSECTNKHPLDSETEGRSQNHVPSAERAVDCSLFAGKDIPAKNVMGKGCESGAHYLSCIGNVVAFKDEGIEVRWATGLISKVQPSEISGLDRIDYPASGVVANEEAVSDLDHKEMIVLEKDASRKEEKDDSHEDCFKNMWAASAFSIPIAAIGFFTNVARSLFGSHGSTSPVGSVKSHCLNGPNKTYNLHLELPTTTYKTNFRLCECEEVTELQTQRTEEPQHDEFDWEPVNFCQHVEDAKQNKELQFVCNEKLENFKKFDVVADFSDHHFVDGNGQGLSSSQVKRGWLKKVQKEWSILEKDLPDGIYVRVYEERIDLLRAAIVGPSETPYHDGLFFFDILLPPDYPHEPPMVHYNSGGLRLNPNLYESGKVCLSLLKTWTGTGTEVWNPESSTILQLLLSLQALVLNDKPYFNEAGYDKQIGRAEGEKNSITYNENAFLLSLKTMLYILRKPPKHFEKLMENHFALRSRYILLACKAYLDGAQVGCAFKCSTIASECQKSSSTGFKIMLAKIFPKLISSFNERGIKCDEFLDQVTLVPNADAGLKSNLT